jgi:hypothetical protein
MKPVFASRATLLVMIVASVFVAGCGKSDDANADAPKGTPQRSDVQSATMGSGSGQQSMSSTQKPNFDTSK